MKRPVVYSYSNFRTFLKDHYEFSKANLVGFTYERFSEKAGIKAPNFLKLVIDQKKNLTTETLLKFAHALELDASETNFFEALVLENQASSQIERRHFKKRLRSLAPSKTDEKHRLDTKLGLFTSPRIPAAIVLLDGEPISSAANKLTKTLGLTSQKSERLIGDLQDQQILEAKGDVFQLNFKHGVFHKGPTNSQLKGFLKSHLDITYRAFLKRYNQPAKFFSHSMGIEENRFDEFIDDIDNFIAEMNKKYDVQRADKVLQFNAQCFWLERDLLGPTP